MGSYEGGRGEGGGREREGERGREREVASDDEYQGFRGGFAFKAHRLLYHSTLGLRVIKKKKKKYQGLPQGGLCRLRLLPPLDLLIYMYIYVYIYIYT